MGAASPAFGNLHITRIEPGRSERVRAGAAIFEQRSFGRVVPPAKQAALMDRMKRVDKQQAPCQWKSSRDTLVAEPRHNGSFGSASYGEEDFIHDTTIQPDSPGWH